MKKQASLEELTIMEAVDMLSNMAEIDPKELKEIVKKIKAGEEPLRTLYWLDLKEPEKTTAYIKSAMSTIHRYLQYFYTEERSSLKDSNTQRGLTAMMALAKEAATVMDECAFALNETTVSTLKEYTELQDYYLKKIIAYMQEKDETGEWQDEWGTGPGDLGDLKRRGIKDLEMVKKDRDYELFYIRKEDGSAFFNRDLLRHLKLVTSFDESLTELFAHDPLTKVIFLHDREMHASAKQIRAFSEYDMAQFYTHAMQHQNLPLVSDLNAACMALMMASNPQRLMQNTTGKSCVSYFNDFQTYLRRVLSSANYIQLNSGTIDPDDHLNRSILNLAHTLVYSFFSRVGHREEVIAFIYGLIAKRNKPLAGSIWNQMIEIHEEIFGLLKHFPSGPLFKALDVFQLGEDFQGFDPIAQGNYPLKSYVVSFRKFHTDILRVPSPTRQQYIQKAELDAEFQGYLRHLTSLKRGDQHLIINLQDRTSWEERARCTALEQGQSFAEFADTLTVVTLPKYTDFYTQSDVYLKINNANDFISLILEQIKSGEECGFFFPKAFAITKAVAFSEKALPLIHKCFFGAKNVLSRKNRLDFIEIFYYFLTLKIIEEVQPLSCSFTCKDAIDVGGAFQAGFYSFIKLMSRSPDWHMDEKDFLIWMFFAPAITIRDRAIDRERLSRTISALSTLNAELDLNRNTVIQNFNKLYLTPLFTEVSVFPAQQ